MFSLHAISPTDPTNLADFHFVEFGLDAVAQLVGVAGRIGLRPQTQA